MGSDEVKAENLCVMIMFRRWEDKQDDISEMSD